MSVISISERKWDATDDPAKVTPQMALEAALRAIQANTANHAFVCIARRHEDGGVSCEWMQAGDYDTHGQLGLLERAKADLLNAIT